MDTKASAPQGAAMRPSEEQFRLMMDAVQDYAIFMLDPGGHVISWNAGAERIKGYQASEIIGKHFSCFYPERDVTSGKPQRVLDTATREGRAQDEGWRLRKDGSEFWANVLVTALRDRSGVLVGFSKVTRDATERMQAEAALQQEVIQRREAQQRLFESEESLRRLSLHLLRTQDEERRRIGREMHDTLGQYLSVLKMKLDALKSAQPSPAAPISRELTQCAALLAECVKEVRTISYLLYPPMLEELGLKSAIPWYLDGFTQRSGIKTTFEISDDFERLSPDVELALFRVLQEALTNVHRHSGSATADIRLLRANGTVSLEITDHGKGAPQGTLEKSGPHWMRSLGVGLRGMNERMRQLSGTLDLSSAGTGTTVRATVPVQEDPSSSIGYQPDGSAPQLGL